MDCCLMFVSFISNTMGATNGGDTAFLSGTHDFTPGFFGEVCVDQSSVF